MATLQNFYTESTALLSGKGNNETAALLLLRLVTTMFLRGKSSKKCFNCLNGALYDFIIVGGGTAGCVVANRLSENKKWRILLLEGGGEETEVNGMPAYKSYSQSSKSSILWHHWTQPEPRTCGGRPCFWPGGKVLGGTSAVNTMIYSRGFKKDYDYWYRSGNYGWDWETVLHYFKKSENNLNPEYAKNKYHHSTGGYLSVQTYPYQDKNIYTVLQAYKELGYNNTDYNGPHPTGIFLMQATVKKGVRQSTNEAFLKPVRRRRNLNVVTDHVVTKLLINRKTKAVRGVEYVLDKNRERKGRVFAKKEVILCAGTLASPKILMLSGIGPEETLGELGIRVIEDLKVGYNLQNHPTSVGVTVLLTKTSTIPKTKKEWLEHITQYVKHQNGPLSAPGISQLSGYIPSSFATDDYPDLKFGFSLSDIETEGAFVPSSYYSKINIGPYLMRPRSRGHLTINSTDPFASPLIYPNNLQSYIDRKPLIEGHLFAMELAKTKAFQDNGFVIQTKKMKGCEMQTFGTAEYFDCALDQYIGTAHHLTGTCKMGSRYDDEAVVDPELRVYGIRKLRVADVSIIPYIPSGNTNAMAIMIGEKVSDMIKESFR